MRVIEMFDPLKVSYINKEAGRVYGYALIRIAFEQAEKEVQDLHQRTREGIETARQMWNASS